MLRCGETVRRASIHPASRPKVCAARKQRPKSRQGGAPPQKGPVGGQRHTVMSHPAQPGLYSPEFEHDACGFGMIAQMDDQASHKLVKTAIRALERMTHRGAIAADGKTGDGCGLLMKKPDRFLRAKAAELKFKLGEHYCAGNIFLSQDPARAARAREVLGDACTHHGLKVLGWRELPINPDACGAEALKTLPCIEQVFIVPASGTHKFTF